MCCGGASFEHIIVQEDIFLAEVLEAYGAEHQAKVQAVPTNLGEHAPAAEDGVSYRRFVAKMLDS